MTDGGRRREEHAAREQVMEDRSGMSDQQAQAEPEKFTDLPLAVQVGENRTYEIKRKLGGGGFGVVYVGESPDGAEVAVKFEHIKESQGGEAEPDPDEWQAYDDLCGIDGIPHIHYKGRQGAYYVTIMDLLGPCLRAIQEKEPDKITVEWVIDIAIRAILILEKVHARGYVHGDIKPHNLLLGLPGTPEEKELFLVDFGLATRWKSSPVVHDDSPNSHVEYDQQPYKFRGTVDYASVHMHLGRTPSRRDDLESLAYTFIILLHGSLPWRGPEVQEENKRHRYFLVCDEKMSTSPEKLCCSLPQCFKQFLEYVVELNFHEKPDYTGCISLFRGLGGPKRSIPKQPIQVRTGKTDNTQWISVYDARQPMKQRYHYDVEHNNLVHFIKKGKEERLFISSVASCNNLWALVIDGGTGFSDQIHKYINGFLDKTWIKEQWDKDYYITSIAGANNGSSLTVMSRGKSPLFCFTLCNILLNLCKPCFLELGTKYRKQEYKVDDYFPFRWVKEKWDAGFYITSMATAGSNTESKWAVVMSQSDSNCALNQAVELDFVYPFEGIHRRWNDGFRITAIAATAKQAAFAFSKLKESTDSTRRHNNPRRQDTYRTSNFPSKYVQTKWDMNFYLTSICYGRTIS